MACMFTLLLTNKCVNQRSMTGVKCNNVIVVMAALTNTSGLGLWLLVGNSLLQTPT